VRLACLGRRGESGKVGRWDTVRGFAQPAKTFIYSGTNKHEWRQTWSRSGIQVPAVTKQGAKRARTNPGLTPPIRAAIQKRFRRLRRFSGEVTDLTDLTHSTRSTVWLQPEAALGLFVFLKWIRCTRAPKFCLRTAAARTQSEWL
jgi:hypothetical protein